MGGQNTRRGTQGKFKRRARRCIKLTPASASNGRILTSNELFLRTCVYTGSPEPPCTELSGTFYVTAPGLAVAQSAYFVITVPDGPGDGSQPRGRSGPRPADCPGHHGPSTGNKRC